jgi:succinoglycan biosynthesis transport protein ExoP
MDARLEVERQANPQPQAEGLRGQQALSESIEWARGFLSRQFPTFAIGIGCCLALGLVYFFTTPRSYTAEAKLLIDAGKLRVLQQEQMPSYEIPVDLIQVQTQVEILNSEKIGLAVVQKLKLTEDPEFVGGAGAGLLDRLVGLFGTVGQAPETDPTRTALLAFLAKRSIKRVSGTYVFEIGFTSLDPARAAAIANATAKAYIEDQLEAKYQATKTASVWLQDRIRELRQQASDADRAVFEYKQQNKIISVGRGAPGGPRLLDEQQLDDLNTQFGSARALEEDAKARLARINDVMQRDIPDASVADALKSEVIIRLRNNYLDLSAKEAVWSAKYGSNHLAAVNLRTQMAELRRAIHDELGRIAETYKSDYEIAKSRVQGTQRELQKSVAGTESTNRARLGLVDLESNAKVYHSIYENFLQKYMEAIQQQSFPITEARIISEADPPRRKSSPKTLLVLGVAGLAGIILSFIAAMLREASDRVFRTPRDVESALHVNCLAVLPRLASTSKLLQAKSRSIAETLKPAPSDLKAAPSKEKILAAGEPPVPVKTEGEKETARFSPISALETLILSKETSKRASSCEISGDRKLHLPREKIMRQVADDPLSAFAEAIRSIKISVDLSVSRKDSKVVGIISTLPGEGKSTLASNLAELIANSGKRIILLDADLRNPSLTSKLAPEAKAGLLEVLAGQANINDVVCFNEQSGMAFIPTVIESHLVQTVEILASAAFEQFIESLRTSYEYVVVDFPPLAPLVDVRATTRVVDSYIYVIEWGKTQRGLVQQQLLAAPAICNQLLGAVLNKSNLGVMRRYQEYYSHYYDRKYYGRYGYSA